MDAFKKLSREAQIILGSGVLLLIISFLDWQQVSFGPITAGVDEWHGIGVLAGLLIFALLAWEAARLFGMKLALGSLSDGLISVGLALALALFTVIAFLTKDTARHWPAWIGLLLAIVIAVAAVMRARAEGVQMPEMAGASTGGGTGMSGSTSGNTSPPGAEADTGSQPAATEE